MHHNLVIVQQLPQLRLPQPEKSIQMLASAKQIQSCFTQRERRLDWIFPQEKSFLAKVGTGTLSLDLL
jgi:hypothetical protein